MSGLIVYGDPHGEWRPLLSACAEEPPEAVIILGDCDLDLPLRRQIAPVFEAGVRVFCIPGNHDADSPERHARLWGDYPEGNLHAAWRRAGGFTVAGLGGVFKERIWYPRFGAAEPVHASRKAYLDRLPVRDQWQGGLPLGIYDAIFPEDVYALEGVRADILVTHEAPSCHRHGFVGIDHATTACGARFVIHGHHHESYTGIIGQAVVVRGLRKAEVFRLPRNTPLQARLIAGRRGSCHDV
jgi:hypothetical protein